MWQGSPIIYPDEFLGQCSMALFNDMFSHLIKVMDQNQKSASFWYIYQYNKKKVKEILCEKGLDINFMNTMAKKLKEVRNQTHFHIDFKGSLDSKAIWKEVHIKKSDITKLIDILMVVLGQLYKEDVSMEQSFITYDGNDVLSAVKAIRKLRN